MAASEPKYQTGAWLESAGPNARMELRGDLPVPTPAADEVLVRLECVGICHSDVHRMYGSGPLLTGILGHEGVGKVVATGSDEWADLMGKRVGVGWLGSACLDCEICEVDYTACPRQKNPGRDVPGAFQQYMTAPAKFVTSIPETLASDAAAPLLCAGVTMYSAIRKLGLRPGAWVAIQGAGGGLGHLGIQICKTWGYRVIAIDSGDEKRELCSRLGADHVIDHETEDATARVQGLTNSYGAHGVICVPGSAAAYTQALTLVRRGGVVSCVGLTPAELPVSPRTLATWGLTIRGSTVGRADEMAGVMAMAARGEVQTQVRTVALGDLDEALRGMRDGALGPGRVVVGMDVE